MEHIRTPKGLCSTCDKAAECTYRRNPELPVWHCNEFEEETIAMMEAARQRNRPNPSPRNNPGSHDSGESVHRGLCSNCEHRFDCTFPRPAGGVWHCEEYE